MSPSDRPSSPDQKSPNNNPLGVDLGDIEKVDLLITVLEKGYDGTKIQLKPTRFNKLGNTEVVAEAILVCKWGGMLTPSGVKQAHMLARQFLDRVIPKDKQDDLLENIQFNSNNERRVRRTAEEFAKELFGKENLPNGLIQDNKETAKLLGRERIMIHNCRNEHSRQATH